MTKTRWILILSLVISIFLLLPAAARFYTFSSGSSKVHLAQLYVEGIFSDSFSISLESLQIESTNRIQFQVSNFNESQKSDVALTYNIVIETTQNIPLRFSIVAIDKVDGMIEGDLVQDTNGRFLSTFGSMDLKKTLHTYELIVEIGSLEMDFYKEIDLIVIRVEAFQEVRT